MLWMLEVLVALKPPGWSPMDDRWSVWKLRATDFPDELKDRLMASEYGMLSVEEDSQLFQDLVNAYPLEKLPGPYRRAAQQLLKAGAITLPPCGSAEDDQP